MGVFLVNQDLRIGRSEDQEISDPAGSEAKIRLTACAIPVTIVSMVGG